MVDSMCSTASPEKVTSTMAISTHGGTRETSGESSRSQRREGRARTSVGGVGARSLLFVALVIAQLAAALRPAGATHRPALLRPPGRLLLVVGTQWAPLPAQALEEQSVHEDGDGRGALGTGDLIAQSIERAGPFAIKRFLTLVAVNVLYIVPVLTLFYAANERLTAKLEAGWPKTLVQLGFDQLINAPIVIAGFFCAFQLATAVADALTGTLASASRPRRRRRHPPRSSYPSTVVSNWKIWCCRSSSTLRSCRFLRASPSPMPSPS